MSDDTHSAMSEQSPQQRSLAFQAWSGGWMMGIGFGVLAVFIATELPNEFYERSRTVLAAAGIATFVFGILRCRSANLLRTIFVPPGGR